MVFYKDLDKRKETVRNYIREHPYTTFREIKKVLHIKINKVYSGGMEEAYKDSGVNLPRTFKRMTGEEKRKIIIDYIKSHPMVGGHTLKRDIKINYQTIFPNIKDAFDAAGILYPQRTAKRLRQKTSDEIIKLIRENPHITLVELMKKSHTNLYLSFKSLREAYQRANIVYMGKGAKRKLNKQEQVINFIKKNSFATQREINCACRTHVGELFSNGIFEAYKRADINFPYERLKLHGAALKEVKESAVLFEEAIAKKLSCYGGVSRLVKTVRGRADVILERKGKKAVIEIKNYKSHEISISQIKQLNKYLEDIGCNLGFLVCFKKPKKDTFLIGKNKVLVLEDSELYKIPKTMDMDPSYNG